MLLTEFKNAVGLHKLTTTMNESQSVNFSVKNFPIIINLVSEAHRVRFENAIQILSNASNVGEILNPVYNDLKHNLNRAIEEAVRTISEKYINAGKWESLPASVYSAIDDAYSTQLHNAPARLKKLIKSDHPAVKEYRALLTEIVSLSEPMSALKNNIVKKLKDVVEKEQEQVEHQTRVSSHKDVVKIRKLLTDITERLYKDALEANYQWFLRLADVVKTKVAAGEKLDRTNTQLMVVSSKMLERPATGNKAAIKSDYKELLMKEAEGQTKGMMEMFIYKNANKLSEIVVKKGNLDTAVIQDSSTSRGIVEGTMALSFKDGSRFIVINKVVMSYSKYYRPFYRFPTTFHAVVLPSGKKMDRPSEQRMITVFCE